MATVTYNIYDSANGRALIITEEASSIELTDSYVKGLVAKFQTDGLVTTTEADVALNVTRAPESIALP